MADKDDISLSSSGDPSNSFDTSTSNGFVPEKEETKIIGEKENRRVFYSRLLVLVVLLLSAGVTGGLTYLLTNQEEQDAFEADVSTLF